MAVSEQWELLVCEDCAMLIANGETPDDDPSFELSSEWDGWMVALNCGDGEECDGFYKSPCDGCGSRLYGSRHHAVAWELEEVPA